MAPIQAISIVSKNRKKGFFSAPAAVSRSGDTSRILKQGGLESSGRILISLKGKTKIIALVKIYFMVLWHLGIL